MGMGGYPLQEGELPNKPYAQMLDKNNYGVGLLDLVNETHAEVIGASRLCSGNSRVISER